MKVKVFFSGYIFILSVFLIGDGCLWLAILFYGGIEQLDVLTWILCGIFAGALPFIVIIWSTFTMANTIAFDEQGVSRIRLGKTIRHINWTDIKSFSSTTENTFTGWIYIADRERKFDYSMISISKMRLDKNVIYFHQSKKAQEAIEKYMPEYCKEKFLKLKDK